MTTHVHLTQITEAAALCRKALETVQRHIIGKEAMLEAILATLAADGHLLLEDVPGVAKTRAAKTFAAVLGLEFHRIQFVPDLLPADITGSLVFDTKQGTFSFRKGPLFTSFLLADEINRGTPKTQAALLEAMQERQISVDGKTFALERPFLVIATQNPIEFEGTYPLPEAQLDRFMARLGMGYPSAEAEADLLLLNAHREAENALPSPVMSREEFLRVQDAVEQVHVDDDLRDYMVRLVRATREDRRIRLGASPRGTLALFRLSRARALLKGREFVLPDDVKAVATPALAHRLVPVPELWAERITGEELVHSLLDAIPVPHAARN